jgi:hypothetical protein
MEKRWIFKMVVSFYTFMVILAETKRPHFLPTKIAEFYLHADIAKKDLEEHYGEYCSDLTFLPVLAKFDCFIPLIV